jgi:hypothetical protein
MMVAENVDKGRRQATIEDRIEQEFRRAIGGIPTIEQMRKDFHARYADNPSLHSLIDHIADHMRQRLLRGEEV